MTKPTTEIILRHTEEIAQLVKRINKLEQAVSLLARLQEAQDVSE